MERLINKKQISLFLIILFFILLIFTRFYNLPQTTRFTRDESSNLVDMHRIWKEKRITFVGPVDVANTIIYPSLTYYMLLPFAVLGNFSPQSPAYGTAFFGVLTVLLLILLTKKINKKLVFLIALLGLVWYPLVESSRWAWNPHLVPFISTIALLLWLKKGKWFKFLSGIFFGLVFHLHYFSIVSSGVFIAFWSLIEISKKKFKDIIFLSFGFVAMIIPFVIFDLRHPPGLFFGKFLTNNLVSQGFSTKQSLFFKTFTNNVSQSLFYITQSNFLALLVGVCIAVLVFWDLKHDKKNLLFFLPVLAQIAAVSFLPYYAGRYFLLAAVLFLIWIITPRNKIGTIFSKTIILIMILGSILTISKLFKEPQIPPGGFVVGKVSTFIANYIDSNNLKNVNVGVLQSVDPDPLGIIYRHTLLVKEKRILSQNEYTITDNLFVITESDEATLRKDQSNIMDGFRNGKAELKYSLSNTPWKVYLFNRR